MLMLLPRILLARPRGGRISKRKLQARITMFTDRTVAFLDGSQQRMCQGRCRSEGACITEMTSRAGFAGLKHSCIWVSCQQVAKRGGSREFTLAQLTNPVRRPPVPHDLPSGSATSVPERPFEVDLELFSRNVRSARRGAAPGPSGMSVEHILGLVESDHDMDGTCQEAFWKGSEWDG